MKTTSFLLISAILAISFLAYTNANPTMKEHMYPTKDSEKHIVHFKTINDFKKAMNPKKGKPTDHLMVFGAGWCPHCREFAKLFAPFITKLMQDKEYQEFRKERKIKFGFVDCAGKESSKLCDHNKVTEYPTIKLFKGKNGKAIPYDGNIDNKKKVRRELLSFLLSEETA